MQKVILLPETIRLWAMQNKASVARQREAVKAYSAANFNESRGVTDGWNQDF